VRPRAGGRFWSAYHETASHRRDWVLVFEPPAAGGDLMSGQAQEPIMSHWQDTMVDRPETDGAVYVTGWTIGAIVVVWLLGI
jgi:hypothetical protein